ncbi:hypothetical protein HGRIS_009624 [Hohenbuehelia grisea]|uniref:DUF2423 domain-containing protein n=1 Tax=Hohenbuehelia grisea TaxID=104357 RepID=A0ABR3J274_9AGAR
MAKSTRSKVKRSFRGKKREEGVYAVTEAARLQRLHAKLSAVASQPKPVHEEDVEAGENDEGVEEKMAGWCWFTTLGLLDSADITVDVMAALTATGFEDEAEGSGQQDTPMDADSNAAPQKVSTHGPRGSRRDDWRASKGLPVRPSRHSTNRQGVPTARRKAGRSKRRR